MRVREYQESALWPELNPDARLELAALQARCKLRGPLFVVLPRPRVQGSLLFSCGQPRVTDGVNEQAPRPVFAMLDTANGDEYSRSTTRGVLLAC